MSDLNFSAVQKIARTLSAIALDDLVAIFSQKSGSRLLLVYNAEARVTAPANDCEMAFLNDLADINLSQYDGLVVGIAALDVIRTDLVTKGPGFYPLDQLLVNLGRRPTLHCTMRNMARYLLTFLNNLPETDLVRRQRVVVKILQLALPALLDQRGAHGLAAILMGADLERFVDGRECRWINFGDDLHGLKATHAEGWVIAFEELSHFNPIFNSNSKSFLELRNLLRQAGYGKALHQTCRDLAERCAQAASQLGETRFWQPAWTLQAEAWLMKEDIEDLVAFLPHADFEHFAQTGEGLRVYRVLNEKDSRISPGPRRALAAFGQGSIPKHFRRYGFSLVPLATLMKNTTDEIEPADLGELLWKAGHNTVLAQTLCFLVRDGLENATLAADLPAAVLSDLAQRAVLLISLGNPWVWRQGRYSQLVASAYQTLHRALLRQAESAQGTAGEYYRALADWYECYNSDEHIDSLLRQMATRLRSFLRVAQDEAEFAVVCNNARQLVEVEQVALYPLATVRSDEEAGSRLVAQALPGEFSWAHDMVARQTNVIACLSPVFRYAWDQLMHLRQIRQQVQRHELNADVLQRRLEGLLADAKKQRRLIFAPPHEMAVLHFIYDREISDQEIHLRALKTEARLQILSLNPRLEFQREVEVVFEVLNTGRVEAREVDLVLAPDPAFELLGRSSVYESSSLLPGVPQRFSYRLRAVQQPEATFNFSYHYAGLEERRQVSLRLPVSNPDEAPFKMKGDPYKFGSAIQNPGDFYGRDEEMKQILSSLYRGGHADFLLRGPRRMGKTSMLYMLKHVLKTPELRRRFDIPQGWDSVLDHYVPIILDLQAFTFQDDVTHIIRFFRALLDTICAVLVPDWRDRLLQNFDKRRQEIDAPKAVLEQLAEVFRQHPQTRIVVLLDEYDEIYQPHGRTLDTALRYVVQEEQRLTWVIASTQFLFKEGKSYGSPWFNILNIIELDCLLYKAAQRLVEEPSKKESVAWQSDAIVALLNETGNHPAFLQLFCSRIMAYLNRERQNYVLPTTIAALAEQIVEERETIHSHFEFYWADTPGMGRLILLAADESDHPTRPLLQQRVQTQLKKRLGPKMEVRLPDPKGNRVPWWEQEFENGMAWVSQIVKALSFNKASRTYTFTVPLFRRWLERKRRYEDLLESALTNVATELERHGMA